MPDIEVSNMGFAACFKPVTEAGAEWIDENVGPEVTWWAGGVVVEFPYLDALIEGAQGDGMEVE